MEVVVLNSIFKLNLPGTRLQQVQKRGILKVTFKVSGGNIAFRVHVLPESERPTNIISTLKFIS